MISYPKFGSYTPMFRIPDMIDEFTVICFIFKDGVDFSFLFVLIKFSWWFLRCFDKLFSALDRKVEGFLKINIKLCTQKIYFIY